MDDREAITRLKQGEIGALAALVEGYSLRAVRAAYLITRDSGLAEEVVQETFIRIYQRIDQFDEDRPFAPWFLRSVCNAAIKAARRRERHLSLEAEGATKDGETTLLAECLADPEPGPEQHAEDTQTRERVWRAMQGLPPRLRAVIVMRYYLGLSEKEMARELHSPAGTVKWLLSTARKGLRRLLQSGREGMG
jgi:RNA polymerase sigma-70 factor (ECF subfamily)